MVSPYSYKTSIQGFLTYTQNNELKYNTFGLKQNDFPSLVSLRRSTVHSNRKGDAALII